MAETSRIPRECLTDKPPLPRRAKIEVTARCDLKCAYCSVTYKERKKGDIAPDLMESILKQMKEFGVEEVGLFWLGESLLCDDLPRYVARAKELGIPYVFITTNGRLASPERFKALVDAGIDSVKFSINAGDRQAYRSMCGADGFDRVIANVRAAWDARGAARRPGLYASTACDPRDSRTYDQVHALIAGHVDQHYLLPVYGPPTYASPGARTLDWMLPCWSLFTEPHISYEGQVSACFADHDPRLFMGDLKTTPLDQVWHSEKFAELRRAHLARKVQGTPCELCVAYPSAAGS